VIGGLVGVFIFIDLVGGTGEPSAPISAPTLSLDDLWTDEPASEPMNTDIALVATRVAQIGDEREPFIIGLVGSTDQVAGDIIVDFDNPPNSRIGTIRVNLRTDEPARNEAIRCCILLSERPEYEFTDFIPTAIEGLPDTVNIGDTVNFQITGDLSLRGITRSLTFDASVTLVSATEITGLATTTILRADYGLLEGGLIEHGVSEEVTLEIEFMARAVDM
jgi:hypothetical protein